MSRRSSSVTLRQGLFCVASALTQHPFLYEHMFVMLQGVAMVTGPGHVKKHSGGHFADRPVIANGAALVAS